VAAALYLTTRGLADRSRILSFLETDRLFAAYAIGDLDPGLAEQSTWAVAEESGPEQRIQSLALCFRGLTPPALFLMGDATSLRAILQQQSYPDYVYLTCRTEHLGMTEDFYTWAQVDPMWRMILTFERFLPVPATCLRLGMPDLADIRELYAHGGGDAFSPWQLEHGTFFGVRSNDQLVAAAGTHLVSHTHELAAIGNVFTRPDHRRHGFARMCTSAVATALFREGIRDIVLNVNQSNLPALTAYRQLGFRTYCAFLEGPAVQRLYSMG
jgi:ribosomal protein S18 acetylase RimI-like enzyme